jgi:hypothetical protein
MNMKLIAAGVAVLTAPSAASAVDTASAVSDVQVAALGQPVTFTSTSACNQPCGLTWRNPDIGLARYGGAIIGYGQSVTYTWTAYPYRSFNGGPRRQVSTGRVSLDLTQPCAPGSRFVCHSIVSVYVDLVDPA